MIHIGWPQGILLGLLATGFGISCYKREGWAAGIAVAIELALLFWGGFFR